MAVYYQLERHRAYRLILDQILGGDIDVNASFSERRLSEKLEMGRTPIREALRDLARDGILEIRPAKGTYLRPLYLEDVREIYEIRKALEGLAAATAAERGASAELRAYGPRFRDIIENPDARPPAEVDDIGADFHLELFRCAQNRNLLEIYEPIRIRFKLALRVPRFADHERVHDSVPEHLDILDAIERQDAVAAQRLIGTHLDNGVNARLKILDGLRDSRPGREPTTITRSAQ